MNSNNETVPGLGFYSIYSDVTLPAFGTEQSACMDVRAYFGTHERMVRVHDAQNKQIERLAFQFASNSEPHRLVLQPGDRALVPTGLILDIPVGYSVRTHIRSSMAVKCGISLCNSEGIIDSDYCHQLWIAVTNNSKVDVVILHGDRIAQIELVKNEPFKIVICDAKPEQKTTRIGGIGSTGR